MPEIYPHESSVKNSEGVLVNRGSGQRIVVDWNSEFDNPDIKLWLAHGPAL